MRRRGRSRKDRRKRERRWMARQARRMGGTPRLVAAAVAAPVLALAVVRGGLRVEASPEGLRLETEEYHCAPLHLSVEDLAGLGFALDERPLAPPSVALQWAAQLDRPADRVRRGPAVSDPAWREPEGVQLGDFLVAPVQGGIDIFVTSFGARPVVLDEAARSELGLQRTRHGRGSAVQM